MTAISRRRFLQGVGATGAAVVAAPALLPTSAAEATQVLQLDRDPVLHVLRRFTFGPSTTSVTALRAMPGQTTEEKISTWFEQQLKAPPTETPDAGWEKVAGAYKATTMSAYDSQSAYFSAEHRALEDTQCAACVRPVYSEWQVREVMVEFWSAHFSTFGGQDNFAQLSKATDVRDVLRRNALGTFRGLLQASAKSAHMLNFLDNQYNRKANLNENYAREVLELHTLGADAFYNRSTWRGGVADPAADLAAAEADVSAAACALTGWEFYGYTKNSNLYPTYGLFFFNKDRHKTGPLSLYNGEWKHANAGADTVAGESMLDFLAGHPATAEHLCRKLCAFFIDERFATPAASASSGVLAAAIAAYLQPLPGISGTPGTDIKAVLRAIRTSPEFASSAGAKWRRPVELVSAMFRALGAEVTPNSNYYLGYAHPAGATALGLHATLCQKPYEWRTPDGFPDGWESWLGAGPQLTRWNVASSVVSGLSKQVRDASGYNWYWTKTWNIPTATELAGGATRPTTARGVVRALTNRICLQQFTAEHENALLAYLGFEATPDAVLPATTLDAKGAELVRLILSSPYFQLR